MLKKRCIMVCLLLLLLNFGCAESKEARSKVLLIFSYHAEYSWVMQETKGVEDVLNGKSVEIDTFYLDTKRKTSVEWKEEVVKEAVNKINDFEPDVVIVFDDNACELVAKEYIGSDLPFVFCGMNGEPEDYSLPAKNITGVVERIKLEETIEFLKILVPDVEKIAIITDNSPSSQAIITRARENTSQIDIEEFYSTDDIEAWKAKVEGLQSRVDAIGLVLYHTLKAEGEESSLPAEDVLEWTIENSNIPEFAVFDFTVRGGALCGVTLTGYEQGKAAAELAVEITEGSNPSDIPVQSPEKGKPIINEERANELNLAIPAYLSTDLEIVP